MIHSKGMDSSMTMIHHIDKTPKDEMDNLVYNVLAVLLKRMGGTVIIQNVDFLELDDDYAMVEVLRHEGELLVQARLTNDENEAVNDTLSEIFGRHPADFITG